jgi:hypothetical protein
MTLLIYLFAACTLYPKDIPIKYLSDGIDLCSLMTKNSAFLKMCIDFDFDERGDLYFLDAEFGTILHVQRTTGKLLKTISSKGQGPHELDWPISLRIKGGKIYVYDRGYGGMKIFGTAGENGKDFKIAWPQSWGSVDVNSRNQIFIGSIDHETSTLMSVYDENGIHLRNIVSFDNKSDQSKENYFANIMYFKFRLDSQGNIYLLFPVGKKALEKYDANGLFLWRRIIENEILDRYSKKDAIRFGENRTVRFSESVFNLDITPNDNIIVGHVGGGMEFDGSGNTTRYICFKPEMRNMYLFRTYKNILVSVLLFGDLIDLYEFQEKEGQW